jgi:hypothetical protein
MADVTIETYIGLIKAAPEKDTAEVKRWVNLVEHEIESINALSTTVVSKSVMRRFNETAHYYKLELKEALETIPASSI